MPGWNEHPNPELLKKLPIALDMKAIEEFCRARGIRRLALFGSVLRDDFRPQSDVDMLVEFLPGTKLGLKFFGVQDNLGRMLGRTVDLYRAGGLSGDFRDRILSQAEVIYEQA